MRNAYTYQGILSAVGRVLDEAGVKRIAIHDTGDGLIVEGFDAAGESQVTLRYDVPALYELVTEYAGGAPRKAMTPRDEGTLRHVLERRELVGTH